MVVSMALSLVPGVSLVLWVKPRWASRDHRLWLLAAPGLGRDLGPAPHLGPGPHSRGRGIKQLLPPP